MDSTTIISLLVGLIGGGVLTYLIARHYYRKTAEDQEQMTQELKQTVRELKDYALGGLRPYAADLLSALERLEGKFVEGEGRLVIERDEDGTPRQVRIAPTQVIRAGESISSEEAFGEDTVLVGPPPTPSRRVVALEITSHGQATARVNLSADVREWALALLRAMNETAQGRTDVVVGPDTATVMLAGLEYEQVDPAMAWLLDEGAIEPDEVMQARSRRLVGQPTYGMSFYITERGLALLR